MNKSDVFISYRRKNKDFIQQLDRAFKTAGREVWVDWEDIPPGSNDFTEEIRMGIDGAETFIAVLTPSYLVSPHCLAELDYAVQNHKKLIPIVLEDVDPVQVPPSLTHINWVYFNKEDVFEKAFEKTLAAIDTDLDYVRMHTRLLLWAKEWEKKARDSGSLLRGRDLIAAERWLQSTSGSEPKPSELHQRYIKESQQARTARLRVIVITTLITLIITILGLVALWQSIVAKEQRDEALKQEQIAQTNAVIAQSLALSGNSLVVMQDNNTDLAVLLALASIQTDETHLESERALSNAAYAPGTRRVFAGHTSTVTEVKYLPNGHQVVSASDDSTLRLWDVQTGELLHIFGPDNPDTADVLEGHSAGVSALDVSDDGKWLLSGGRDNRALVWNIETGEIIHVLEGHADRIRGVDFSADGLWAVSGGHDDLVILWNVETGQEERRFSGHTANVMSVAFSPNSEIIASSSVDETIRLWNVATGEEMGHFGREEGDPTSVKAAHEALITHVAFSPDGTRLVSASGDATLAIWNMETGEMVRRLTGHTDYIFSATFNTDGKTILSASSDDSIRLWDVDSGLEMLRLAGHGGRVRSVDFDPNVPEGVASIVAISGSEDNTLRLWDLQSGAKKERLLGHSQAVWGVSVHPNGTLAVSSGGGRDALHVWNIETGETERVFRQPSGSVLYDVTFSPDGTQLLAGSNDGSAMLIDFETLEVIYNLKDHDSAVLAVAFSPDGKRALTGSTDTHMVLWDLETGTALQTFEGHQGYVRAVAFTPDGLYGLSASEDTNVILWDLATGEPVHYFGHLPGEPINMNYGHSDYATSLAISPNGQWFVSGGDDNRLILWDLNTRQEIKRFEGHIGPVLSVAFSPDNESLISGSADDTVRVWDIASGLELRRLTDHDDDVTSVAFTPDGKLLLSGSKDARVIVWLFHRLEALQQWTLENRFVREFSCGERVLYRVTPLCEAETTQ